MKRLPLLGTTLLALAASQPGHPHKPGQAGQEIAITTRPPHTEPGSPVVEPPNAPAPSRLIVVFGPPPPPPTIRIPPLNLCEPAALSTEEIAQARREIETLMRGAPWAVPPVEH